MAYTLAQARTRVRTDYLDDPSGERWADAEIDRHIVAALHRVVEEMVAKGCRWFDALVTGTTTDSKLDLTTYDPLLVRDVLITNGGARWVLPRITLQSRQYQDNTSREIEVSLVRAAYTPTLDTHYLLADHDTPTSAAEWSRQTVEELICLEAVSTAALKDGNQPSYLPTMLDKYGREVERHFAPVKGRDLESVKNVYHDILAWDFKPGTQEVVIHRHGVRR